MGRFTFVKGLSDAGNGKVEEKNGSLSGVSCFIPEPKLPLFLPFYYTHGSSYFPFLYLYKFLSSIIHIFIQKFSFLSNSFTEVFMLECRVNPSMANSFVHSAHVSLHCLFLLPCATAGFQNI